MLVPVRSVPAPESVTALVHARYSLDVERCVPLRSSANDVYLLHTRLGRHVLKIYGARGRSLAQVLWEQELVTHLHRFGVPVPPVTPLADGRLAATAKAPEGERPFVPTRFVEGSTPAVPFNDALYRDLGTLTAQFHEAARTFGPQHHRPPRMWSTC